MNVFSYISTFIILGLGLLYLVVKSNYNECPHPNFKFKHWCENCSSEIEALDFTVARRNFDTGRNTVLAGFDLQFEIINGKCVNSNWSTVYECNVFEMRCLTKGHQCKTLHALHNGHMFYKNTYCI